VAPDVGFVARERCAAGLPACGFFPAPSELAVEVTSPNHDPAYNAQKLELYRQAEVPLVWWVDPVRKTVIVYRLGQAPGIIEATGVLDGGDVPPGFTLQLQTIFRD
jgi:Uma2 family endonuclease